MLRRNWDAIAIGIACFGMAMVSHIPPRAAATVGAIRFESAVIQNRCTLIEIFLSRFK